MTPEYVVIGLGRFGAAVARELARRGQAVLALDVNADKVEELSLEIETVAAADATDEAVLRELHVQRMACAIVAIGTDSMEASILATALLRQLGVPRIIARSLGPLHARVLLSVGAHTVVNPEQEIGQRVARRLVQPNILEKLSLAGDVSLAELSAPPSFVGHTPIELKLRERYDVTVVAVRRDGDVQPVGAPDDAFREDDVLIVVGSPEAIDRLAELT